MCDCGVKITFRLRAPHVPDHAHPVDRKECVEFNDYDGEKHFLCKKCLAKSSRKFKWFPIILYCFSSPLDRAKYLKDIIENGETSCRFDYGSHFRDLLERLKIDYDYTVFSYNCKSGVKRPSVLRLT